MGRSERESRLFRCQQSAAAKSHALPKGARTALEQRARLLGSEEAIWTVRTNFGPRECPNRLLRRGILAATPATPAVQDISMRQIVAMSSVQKAMISLSPALRHRRLGNSSPNWMEVRGQKWVCLRTPCHVLTRGNRFRRRRKAVRRSPGGRLFRRAEGQVLGPFQPLLRE